MRLLWVNNGNAVKVGELAGFQQCYFSNPDFFFFRCLLLMLLWSLEMCGASYETCYSQEDVSRGRHFRTVKSETESILCRFGKVLYTRLSDLYFFFLFFTILQFGNCFITRYLQTCMRFHNIEN